MHSSVGISWIWSEPSIHLPTKHVISIMQPVNGPCQETKLGLCRHGDNLDNESKVLQTVDES